jgi:hypothetical protein
MIDQDQAIDEAVEAAGAKPADRLIERLAELIGAKAGVRAVFGEPVQQGGVTVIPIVRAKDLGGADHAGVFSALGTGSRA